MTFLHPWAIWAGLTAAAIPIAVHWLTRPRPTRMPLSTLRFVREAIRQRRARHRLRDFVILALRTLAVLLLALAVARPQWGPQPLVSDAQSGEAVRVVILDLSQSLAAMEGAVQRIQRARATAANYLRYRPGLRANLILAGASARAVFEQPSANFEALGEELARCEVLPQRLEINAALELAARMLAPATPDDARRRELIVVSDFQRSNWTRANFGPLPEATLIQLESVAGAPAPENLAILGVAADAAGARGPSAQLRVEIGNFSPQTRNVVVEVTLGENTRRLKAVCPPGQSTTLTEEIDLRDLGWRSGQARLIAEDDALAADNLRPLVAEIRPEPSYALISRQRATERPSSSHFLECALAPEKRPDETAAPRVLRLEPDRVDRASLVPADLIVLDHPGLLAPETISLLAGLLRRGRPILYVAAEAVDATNLKRLGEAAGGGLQMPVEFTPPPAGHLRQDLVLTSVARDQSPFRVFGDHLTAVLGPLRFAGGLSSRRREAAFQEDLLATYSDGSACLICTSSDAGALAVLNADLAAGNLPRTGAFVPLVEELVERLLGRRLGAAAWCGEPLVVHLPAEAGIAAGLDVAGPSGAESGDRDRPCGELTDEAVGVVWHWAAPSPPGVYRVERDGDTVFSLPVLVPPEESQLESLSPEVLRDRLAAGRDVYYRAGAGDTHPRDDAWKWFALACALCMVSEIGVLLVFRT